MCISLHVLSLDEVITIEMCHPGFTYCGVCHGSICGVAQSEPVSGTCANDGTLQAHHLVLDTFVIECYWPGEAAEGGFCPCLLPKPVASIDRCQLWASYTYFRVLRSERVRVDHDRKRLMTLLLCLPESRYPGPRPKCESSYCSFLYGGNLGGALRSTPDPELAPRYPLCCQ